MSILWAALPGELLVIAAIAAVVYLRRHGRDDIGPEDTWW